MKVYKIGRSKFIRDIKGEGARLHGGRWNNKLTACIYTSETRALALLEYTVNVRMDDIPRALSIVTFEVPDTDILELNIPELPGDWRESPAPPSTKNFGTNHLKKATHLAIKVPSVVIPEEYNLILNPMHINSHYFKIVDVQDFVYDVRIKSEVY